MSTKINEKSLKFIKVIILNVAVCVFTCYGFTNNQKDDCQGRYFTL